MYYNDPLNLYGDDWPEHWPVWVKDALDELERIERRFPKDILSGAPAWVDKMSLRIIQMMYPASRIGSDSSGPAILGSTLGHLMWLIESEHGITAMVQRFAEASERIDALLQEKLSPEAYQQFIDNIEKSETAKEFERLSRSFIRLLIRKERVVRKCLALASNAHPSEQVAFYEAYSKAMDKPPIDETGALTHEKFPGVGSIYLLLVLNWKHVITLRSGAECHAWLCTILGERLIGSKHRIEKMCYNYRVNFSRRKRKRRKKKRRNRK